MEALKSDSVGACFVNMVMDRLHNLEGKHMQEVAELKDQNRQLAHKVQDLQQCVYLRDDLKTFSDGAILDPGFALYPDMLNKDVAGHITMCARDSNIDDMHLDAVAVLGRIALDIEMEHEEDEYDDSDTLLIVGTPGQSTSVRQLLIAWNAHCVKLREADRMPMIDNIDSYLGFHCFGYDAEQEAPVYCLTLD